MNLPQNILLEHRWIANLPAAKGHAIFFAIAALLLIAYAFFGINFVSDAQQAAWERNLPSVRAAVADATPSSAFGPRMFSGPRYDVRIGMRDYHVYRYGSLVTVTPANFVAGAFAPSFALGIGDESNSFIFWFRHDLGRDAYLLIAAAFLMASLYCTIINRRGGNLPPDAYAKLCK